MCESLGRAAGEQLLERVDLGLVDGEVPGVLDGHLGGGVLGPIRLVLGDPRGRALVVLGHFLRPVHGNEHVEIVRVGLRVCSSQSAAPERDASASGTM